MALEIQKVTESQIDSVDLSLQKAPFNLRLASMSLKSCFMDNLADVTEFVGLRDEVHKGAIVFKDGLLPLSETVVRDMNDFFEYYVALTQEEWTENLDTIVEDAERYQLQCDTLSDAYTDLLTDLKKLEAPANEVQSKLGLDAQEFEAKALAAERLAETSGSKASIFNVAGDVLCSVPFPPTMVLGPLAKFIALKFTERADMQHAEGVANQAQKEIAFAALKAISELLIPSIERFISAMTDIAGFFHVLASEVMSFKEKGETSKGDPKKIHYIMMKHKATGLREKCALFIAATPAFKSDLEAIPAEKSVNWVSDWLAKKRQGKSLFDSFKKLKASSSFPQSMATAMQELCDSDQATSES